MSLLLDALRTTESSAPSTAEPNDEAALDGRDALKILTANLPASANLTLEASPPSPSALDSAAPPDIALPRESPGDPRSPPMGRPGSTARPGLPPLSRAAPIATTPARRMATMLAVAVAVVTFVLLGKSLLHKNAAPITYPDVPQLSAVASAPATAPDPNAVQVPSRPASQFSGVGGAPEIDLHEDLRPAPARTPAGPTLKHIRPDKPRAEPGAAAQDAPTLRGSLSVAPSGGVASVDAHIESGYRALASGDLATAQREYRAALELDENNVDALLGTASTAARAGNSARAAAAYAKVLKVEPGNPDATAALAILNRDPAATEDNESRLKVMIAADNERRPALHVALAGVYAADRRWADAAQEYFIALSLDPNDSQTAFNLAASLDQNHNGAAALTYYTQALALAKQHAAPIDVHAVEARISQLQAHIDVRATTPRAAP